MDTNKPKELHQKRIMLRKGVTAVEEGRTNT